MSEKKTHNEGNNINPRKGGRQRMGQLIWREKTGWHARVTAEVDGEKVRVMRALGTKNKIVAKRKLVRLNAAENASTEDVKRGETFAEAAERVYEQRRQEGAAGAVEELASLRRYVFGPIGQMGAMSIEPTDVNQVLDACKALGKSRGTVQHLRQRVSNVFSQLRREGVIKLNPVSEASMPGFQETTIKERSVLTDNELAIYLAWEHPVKHRRMAVLERQVMACVARMFGGLRTGDLHALQWDAFDVERGAFAWGYAPRQKTRRPQLLEVAELLRPFLRDWWERAGRPTTGFLFPARRVGKRGDRIGQGRLGVSHAAAFRRDLKRAFKLAKETGVDAPAADSRRWRELFEETDYTLPVDFHSWRRAFAQALADADVSAQQAIALTGHSDMSVHARYLKSAGKMRRIPENALPQILLREKALGKGTSAESGRFDALQTDEGETDSDVMTRLAANGGALLSRRSQVRVLPGALVKLQVVFRDRGSRRHARDHSGAKLVAADRGQRR